MIKQSQDEKKETCFAKVSKGYSLQEIEVISTLSAEQIIETIKQYEL